MVPQRTCKIEVISHHKYRKFFFDTYSRSVCIWIANLSPLNRENPNVWPWVRLHHPIEVGMVWDQVSGQHGVL